MASAKVQNLKAQFALFDKDGSGKLSKEEVKGILTQGGSRISEADADDFIATFDADRFDQISIEEFAVAMCHSDDEEGEDVTAPPQGDLKKVALLTAGGLAPCLSSAVASLITTYSRLYPDVELICYTNGYQGLLLGNSIQVTPAVREAASSLHIHGGSPIGNSRVKLTNKADCEKRKLVKPGEDPQRVAADQLVKDGVDVLHTIGGDDTNTAAADLAAFLARENYQLTVIGLPKTIDNDVFPITQSLGADTAAEMGAAFFESVGAEATANPRMMIVHEVMGRDCGWLTAMTAHKYRTRLGSRPLLPGLGLDRARLDVHAVYIPEVKIDIEAEAKRLRAILDETDSVNVFVSEGAGVKEIVAQMEAEGKEVQRDAFGHVKLDTVNPGKYLADTFSKKIGAEKVLVQKSGYFSRAAPANAADAKLIARTAEMAVRMAALRTPGVCAMDEDQGDVMRCIEFERIRGGKPFNIENQWFKDMLSEIGQVEGRRRASMTVVGGLAEPEG